MGEGDITMITITLTPKQAKYLHLFMLNTIQSGMVTRYTRVFGAIAKKIEKAQGEAKP